VELSFFGADGNQQVLELQSKNVMEMERYHSYCKILHCHGEVAIFHMIKNMELMLQTLMERG
jgi:hypothetical protein